MADVGVSKEANMITGTVMGTPSYIAPEVILSRPYDYKADIYSFSIMLWEMWYGKKAFHDVEGDLREFYDQVVKGNRPAHVEDRMKPPTAWQDLMQRCWDEKADIRPDATACHMELTTLYQDPMSIN